jgi:hypothetical protein
MPTQTNYAKALLFLFLLSLFHSIGYSQTVKGTVLDSQTGEPMTGATVTIKETGKKQFVQLNGLFNFKNVAEGDYELEVTFANYKTYKERISVGRSGSVPL